MDQNQIPTIAPVTPAPLVTPVVVPPKPAQTSYGALIALIIIIAAVTAGAYYLFTARVNELVDITESQQAAIAALDTQSNSTEPEAIESDLAAKSPDAFDAEMDEAFAAFEASFEAQ